MAEIHLQTPLTEDVVRKLALEDTVYIDGHVFGIRDATQIRIFDEGVPPPTDLTGAVCLHTAPGVRKLPNHPSPVILSKAKNPAPHTHAAALLDSSLRSE